MVAAQMCSYGNRISIERFKSLVTGLLPITLNALLICGPSIITLPQNDQNLDSPSSIA